MLTASTPSDIIGFLDVVSPEKIKGWAALFPGDGSPVRVVLSIADSDIAEIEARQLRPGVAKSGKHPTGECGFELAGEQIPEQYRSRDCWVRAYGVTANGRRKELQNSPRLLRWSKEPAAAGEDDRPDSQPCTVLVPPMSDEEKTIVVLGVSRGGTSLISGILRLAKVFMGSRLSHDSHEDMEFHTHDLDRLRELIGERNAEHRVWGWKYPHSIDYLEQIRPQLRNPHFVVVFRDLVGVAQGFERRNGIPIAEGIKEAHRRYAQLVGFVTRCTDPLMVVSYEKAMSQRTAFLDAMAGFCGYTMTGDMQRRSLDFIQPGRYVVLKPEPAPRGK